MTEAEVNASLAAMRPKMLRAARSILNGTRQFDVDTAAEDVVQDAMLSCWLNGTASEANVHTMVVNRSADFLDGQDVRSRMVAMDMDRLSSTPDPSRSKNETDPHVMEIWKAAERLSIPLYSTFYRHYFWGDSCEEISAMSGVPVGTVKRRLYEARVLIREIVLIPPNLLLASAA